jgi:hypothetical protein
LYVQRTLVLCFEIFAPFLGTVTVKVQFALKENALGQNTRRKAFYFGPADLRRFPRSHSYEKHNRLQGKTEACVEHLQFFASVSLVRSYYPFEIEPFH